eukprot:310194-Chlamydomonas_euryale.AAC.1
MPGRAARKLVVTYRREGGGHQRFCWEVVVVGHQRFCWEELVVGGAHERFCWEELVVVVVGSIWVAGIGAVDKAMLAGHLLWEVEKRVLGSMTSGQPIRRRSPALAAGREGGEAMKEVCGEGYLGSMASGLSTQRRLASA